MITSKQELKEYLSYEKTVYFNATNGTAFEAWLKCSKHWRIWQYIRTLRKSEYYMNSGHKLAYAVYHRKKHKLGNALGFEIPENCVGKGLAIYHISPVIINGKVRIGKDFHISGNFCAGHKNPDENSPVLGDNITAGWGSSVIGDVHVASGVVIGAGAVVVSDIVTENVNIAGVPARILG